MVLNHRSPTKNIQVYVAATSTFYQYARRCRLSRICYLLNKRQDVFHFVSVSPDLSEKLRYQNRVLQLTKNSKLLLGAASGVDRKSTIGAVINSYYVDLDVFAQVKKFIKAINNEELSPSSFVAVVGSEAVIPDLADNDFEGNSSIDAYSCLGNTLGEDDWNNNVPKSFSNIAFVSLARLNNLFPLSGSAKFDRAVVARYIIANICVLLADKSFGETISHEHMAKCVLNTWWSGIENERSGYTDENICDECAAIAQEKGVAGKFKKLDLPVTTIVSSLNEILREADRIVEASRRSYRYLIELFLVVFGTGLSANLGSGYSLSDDFGEYVWNHRYQCLFVIVFYLVGALSALRAWAMERSLP